MENQNLSEMVKWKVGYAADPAIEMLLPKEKIALIKVHEIDLRIRELESVLESLRLTQKIIKEQYSIK